MRLFKSSNNKSQASLDRLSGSRDHSPTQQGESAYPQKQAYGGPNPSAYPPPPQFQQPQRQSQQPVIDERYYTDSTAQQHPAHALSRKQSNRVSSGGADLYAQDHQPAVNVVPPANTPIQTNQYLAGQTQFGHSQTVRTEKEHKKSKRSIFGFSKDKKEDKEEAGDRRIVGRTGSVLRRSGQQQTAQTSPRSNTHQFTDPRQAALHEARSSENLPEDPDHYDQYYRQQDQYPQQDQFDSPQSSHTRQSIQYIEDPRYQHPSHDQQPRSYQFAESSNVSDSNLPYQSSRISAATYEHNSALRPPSQTSLGPPSPLVAQPPPDSRPSSSNTQQQRFSTQSQQANQINQQQQKFPAEQQVKQQTVVSSSQQPTPQPQVVQQVQQQHQPLPLPQPPLLSQQSSTISVMGRGDVPSGRRNDESVYAQQDPRVRTQTHEQTQQGRSTPPPGRTRTPPPNRGRDDLSQLDYHQLLSKHEELLLKYSKVKRYYFEREAQVTQLQNTVATQRLSMSKTSLDDAGYTTRFDRLNGAIQNIAFNIRKDWRRVPNWLSPVCNRDAHSVGTKEMTAVGRACITRWLYEFIFERLFHPGIDPNLSMHLKTIERNLRGVQYSSPLTSEQQDDLMTKITTWRLTTVEGLQDVLASRQSEAYSESIVLHLTRQLETYLRAFLADPPPPGLTDGLGAIVSQTIGITHNIPMESRDICVEYFMPGTHISDAYMRIESGMTALTQPGSAPSPSDHLPGSNDEDPSSNSPSQIDPSQSMNVEDAIRESAKAAAASMQASSSQQRNESVSSNSAGAGSSRLSQQNSSTSSSAKEKKSGFLGGFVNKKPTPAPSMPPSSRSDLSIDQSKSNDPPDHGYTLQNLTGGLTDGKIRFAVFLAVEVRGRGVLKENTKDSDKPASTKDTDEKKDGPVGSAASGAAASSAATGVQKASTAANILCKAPVYCFE